MWYIELGIKKSTIEGWGILPQTKAKHKEYQKP